MKKISIGMLISMELLTSCGDSDSSSLKEAWNYRNRPEAMVDQLLPTEQGYLTTFDQLPLEAKLSVQPWSGDYWATYRGGITYRWNDTGADSDVERYSYDLNITSKEDLKGIDIKTLSPAEKFDLAQDDYQFTLTKLERERTRVMRTVPDSTVYDKNFKIPTWEGLCHAWAPATIHYPSPKPVTIKSPSGVDVEFGASDLKALLTYNVHLNQNKVWTHFLGQRCNLDISDIKDQYEAGGITTQEYKSLVNSRLGSSACSDTNAGSFHIVLANQIGLADEGFIIDITRDSEVWNQSVFSYKSEILSQSDEARLGAATGTVKTVLVKSKVYYTNEIDFSWTGEVVGPYSDPVGIRTYYYYLELDEAGVIIGGEWADQGEMSGDKESYRHDKDDRPDFLWKHKKIDFQGIMAPLKDIYERSLANGSVDPI